MAKEYEEEDKVKLTEDNILCCHSVGDKSPTLMNMVNSIVNQPNISIVVGDKQYRCSLLVLRAYSAMFQEVEAADLFELPVQKVPDNSFPIIYKWMLSDEPTINGKVICDIYIAAEFLRIPALMSQCWSYLDAVGTEANAFYIANKTRPYEMHELKTMLFGRISKFFLTLVSSLEFLTLNFNDVCIFLKSNVIGVNSEIEVFFSAVRWLNFNWATRKPYAVDAMRCIRFGMMPPFYLTSLLKVNDHKYTSRIVAIPAVIAMIKDGLLYSSARVACEGNDGEFANWVMNSQCSMALPRQWMYDSECLYHSATRNPETKFIEYYAFVLYIGHLQQSGTEHYKTMELVPPKTSRLPDSNIC